MYRGNITGGVSRPWPDLSTDEERLETVEQVCRALAGWGGQVKSWAREEVAECRRLLGRGEE